MAAQQSSDYVVLREGPVPAEVEYMPVAEDGDGYTTMLANKQAPAPHNVFVPVHQRQASRGSRHSSENGRFDMPEYMNAAKDEKALASAQCGAYVSASQPVNDGNHHHQHLPGTATSMNPAYGNLVPNGAGHVTVQGSLTVDDLPPPPPTVSEEHELPFYSDVSKPPVSQGPPTPEAVVHKKEKKSADSVLYTQQSITSKPLVGNGTASSSSGSSTNSQDGGHLMSRAKSSSSSGSEDVHQRRQFMRTLFCLLFVLFLMSAVSLGLCVYLLLTWPSDCNSCSSSPASASDTLSLQATPHMPNPTTVATATGPPPIPEEDIRLQLSTLDDSIKEIRRRVVMVDDFRQEMDTVMALIQETQSTLQHNVSSLTGLRIDAQMVLRNIKLLNSSVREAYENFTDVSTTIDRTLRDGHVFKNCTNVERGCALSTDGSKADLSGFCNGEVMRVPDGHELLSATCETEDPRVAASMQRYYVPNSLAVNGYSCNCVVPLVFRDGTSIDSRCSIRLFYCESVQPLIAQST